MPTPESKKLSSIEVNINRLKAKKAAIENQLKTTSKQDRMRSTRTKIQLGGLIEMVGLAEKFNIKMGDDLQLDPEDQDKSAKLLGLLLDLMEQLPTNLDTESLKNKGILFLKMRTAAKHY